MSKRRQCLLAVSPLLVLCIAAVAVAVPPAGARMVTFSHSTGDTYFALSLTPSANVPAQGDGEIVILFDTSASQTGQYRDDALAALEGLLESLAAADRVRLFALDLTAVEMTQDWTAPQGQAMDAALGRLRSRAPLGSTDIVLGLREALGQFSSPSGERSVVYLGDGISRANLVQTSEFAELTGQFRSRKVDVSSFAIGPRRDLEFLAALGNQTGGILLVDSAEGMTAQQAGQGLAEAARGTVFWPEELQLPRTLVEVLPKQVPPLRLDRDTILVGRLSDPSTQQISLRCEVLGEPRELSWSVLPEASNDAHAFLPRLVESARTNEGLTMPTLGSAGLREAARVVMANADQLTRLAARALSSGDVEGAENVARAALNRDPSNPQAQSLHRAATRKQPRGAEPDLKLKSGAFKPSGFRHSGRKSPFQLVQFTQAPAATDDLPPPADNFQEAPDGRFLDLIEQDRRVKAGLVEAEVDRGLINARRKMVDNPEGARQDLKILLEQVEQTPELDAEVKAELRSRLESAIREAERQELINTARRAEAEEARIIALEAQRLIEDIAREREKISLLMDKFHALMAEENYLQAEDIATEVREMEPDNTTAIAAVWNARFTHNVREMQRIRELRHKNFVDALYTVELAAIPFPDEPPIVYPDAEVWRELTLRRKKYASIDLARTSGAEEKIFAALDEPTVLQFNEEALTDVVDYLKDYHRINIVIDNKALDDVGLGTDTPVTIDLSGISLRSGLRLMLKEMDLTYVIRNEVLQITTPEEAESQLITKVYPVGDLVLPISGANVNPFQLGGGIGGGGGFGQGQGGFGGGGLGGGGFGGGGGLGGGGFGGGGGIFDVEDDLRLGAKQDAPAAAPQVTRETREVTPIELQPTPGLPADQAWDQYFKTLQLGGDEQELLHHAARVRETTRRLMKQGQRLYEQRSEDANSKFAEVVGLLQAALRHGHPQPWMYEVLGLALQIQQAPEAEIERALMSAVDFSENDEVVLFAAMQMARMGLDRRALQLFRQLGDAYPFRPEPFVQGLQAAQRLNDLEGKQWACVGILSQAWPVEHRRVETEAIRVAKLTLDELRQAGQAERANAFESALDRALERDCVVKVTWTGDADIDLMVEEPSGTLCSVRNPRTTSGGVLLGDSFARPGGETIHGYSETYVCPEGFSGEYRLLLRRIWGEVTAGKVTVDIYTRNPERPHLRKQIDLGQQDAVVIFDVPSGRRTEALEDHLVANVADAQQAAGRAVLAQQLNRFEGSEASQAYAAENQQARRDGRLVDPRLHNRRPRQVGFRPIITTLPEGANMTATAVISADRRYVRITAIPFFSAIGQVSTFNFSTGETQNLPGDDDDDDDDDNN